MSGYECVKCEGMFNVREVGCEANPFDEKTLLCPDCFVELDPFECLHCKKEFFYSEGFEKDGDDFSCTKCHERKIVDLGWKLFPCCGGFGCESCYAVTR